MRTLANALIAIALLVVGGLVAPQPAVADPLSVEYPLASGRFYTQTGDSPEATRGFRITDEDGIPFWTQYQNLGGPAVLGYPISRRFHWDGLVVQATQRAVLQWQPDHGQVVVLNLMDKMHDLGLDDWLASRYSVPKPLDPSADAGQAWSEIVDKRLSLLDADPAIKDAYYTLAPTGRLLDVFGLPTSAVEDKGTHFAVRLQRAVLQHWKIDTATARAGQITIASMGEIAREAGLLPPAALEAIDLRDSTMPDLLAPSPQADLAASAAKSSVVKIAIPNEGFGSGFVFTREGHVLTSAHVVGSYGDVFVETADGRRLPGTVLGKDNWTDVAVVKVDNVDVPPLSLGNSDSLLPGDDLAALGYAPLFESAPEPRFGKVVDLDPTTMPGVYVGLVRSDVYLQPGDSGGPLLNLRGEVVGVNAAIRVAGGENGRLISTSIAIDRVKQAVSEIVADGTAERPWVGVSLTNPTPGTPPGQRGVVILAVVPDSPADQAGLSPAQAIVGVNGERVAQMTDLQLALSVHIPGDEVQLRVLGEDGSRKTVTVRLGEEP